MGYVRNTYGCHCFYGDSSFKRYNRAALGDTFIFNYNSNNTYNCCGGQRGGFWGGLGLGLGMGFGNLLGGFCGNLFGGFGNMFGGFGFPSFNFGNWGFGGTPAVSSNNNTSTTKTVTVEKMVDDEDTAKLAQINDKINDYGTKLASGAMKPDAKEISDLMTELEGLIKSPLDGDEAQKKLNIKNYEGAKARLEQLKKGQIDNGDGANVKVNGDEITIVLDGKTINNADDLKNVPDSKLKALKPETAQIILIKLGYINKDAGSLEPTKANGKSKDYLVAKATVNPKVAILQQVSTVAVEVEKYTGSNTTQADYYITGPVSGIETENVKRDNDSTEYAMSYIIDCGATGVKGFQGKYKVYVPKDCKVGDKVKAEKVGGTATQKVYEWTYKGEGQFMINDAADPTVSNK